ncbi:hypothetical protein PoB_004885300 [Plakobranchus ocellatus]|uniref:Uncharacterized protein n=1 Tax=Plakobranchus ocellatus TaxID=259542 RepID=A0AAV4BU72_9GAST|nr:hypothetical protein PoB_004885300 [Plakobranchus ocellatus]
MEESAKKTFTGDSFGNLDLSNTSQDAETDIAVSTGITGKRPQYIRQVNSSSTGFGFPNQEVKLSTSNENLNSSTKTRERDMETLVESHTPSETPEDSHTPLQSHLKSQSVVQPEGEIDQNENDTYNEEYSVQETIEFNNSSSSRNNGKVDNKREECEFLQEGDVANIINTKVSIIDQSDSENGNTSIDINNNTGYQMPQEGETSRTNLSDPVLETEFQEGTEKNVEIENITDEDDDIINENSASDDKSEEEEDDEESDCLLLGNSTRPQTRSTLREVPGGMRAKANTPASQFTNTVEGLDDQHTPKAVQMDSVRPTPKRSRQSFLSLRSRPSPGAPEIGDGTRGPLQVRGTYGAMWPAAGNHSYEPAQICVRNASRGSRDEVFQRAMTLMSNRCTSARGEQEELFSTREPPFGIHIPQYFYVQQKKPSPMSPLKVWRGYKGNVYFEPINVRRIRSAHGDPYSNQLERVSTDQMSNMVASRGPLTPATRATTAASSQALRSYRYIEPPPSASPQVFVMDKQAVINSLRNSGTSSQGNREIQRDLHFIEGMESTGSLAVRPLSGSVVIGTGGARILSKINQKERKLLFKRDRLCKGPNFSAVDRRGKDFGNDTAAAGNSRKTSVHSSILTSPRSSSRFSSLRPGSRSAGPGIRPHRMSVSFPENEPELVVSGDKFAPPTVMSPLLRSTGHFPLGSGGADDEGASGHRAAVNSPDLVDARGMMMAMAMSPPLDPMRINLRHTTPASFDPASGGYRSKAGRGKKEGPRPLTCSEELKPFIKYSHDVKVNY